MPYLAGQAGRLRDGGAFAIAGNHVIVALRESGCFFAVVHLQAGSVRVTVGDDVAEGQQLASCGNSGNSTQPHVHLQVMDSADLSVARGVPTVFRRFREWAGGGKPQVRDAAVPAEGAVVEPLAIA